MQRSRPSMSMGDTKMAKHLGGKAFGCDDTTAPLVESAHARAIKRVLDARSRDVVGWLYQWDTGDLSIMWKDERCDDVTYE